MYVAHTPVDDGSIKVWHGLLVRTANNPPSDDDVRNARAAQAGMLAAFSQDFEIWTHKRPCLSPWAVRTDGSFAHVRTWYRQFYNERAKAIRLSGPLRWSAYRRRHVRSKILSPRETRDLQARAAGG